MNKLKVNTSNKYNMNNYKKKYLKYKNKYINLFILKGGTVELEVNNNAEKKNLSKFL